jgi:hypothetical protein
MRIRALAAVSVVLTLFPLLIAIPAAHADHGGPDSDPTTDFDITNPLDTPEQIAEALLPLNEVITPVMQSFIDANREAYKRGLERLIRSGTRKPAVDLRFRDTPVKKQFGGTCTAFGLMAAEENLLGGQIDLSERHFWSEYHKYSCEAAVKAASALWGVVTSDYWPDGNRHPYYGYMDQSWYKLSKFEHLDGDIAKAVLSLDQGNPVYIAISTPTDMMNKPVHVDPNSGHYKNSGHALAVVGYELDASVPGGGSFILKNSWGPACGDHGYQWYPFSLCTKEGMYCEFWSIQGVSHD